MNDSTSTVYIVRMTDTNYYKIGITELRYVSDRVRNIQQCCPRSLEIVLEFKGANKQFENKLHAIFDNKRLDGGTEWFELSEEDIKRLEERFLADGKFVPPPEKPECIIQRLATSKVDYEVMCAVQRGNLIEVTNSGMEAYLIKCPEDDTEAQKFIEAMREVRHFKKIEEELWTSVTTP